MRGWTSRGESFGGNDQGFVSCIRRRFAEKSVRTLSGISLRCRVLYPDFADVPVVGGIQSVRQAQDRRQLNRDPLLVGQQVAQGLVTSGGQRTRMKARDNRGDRGA